MSLGDDEEKAPPLSGEETPTVRVPQPVALSTEILSYLVVQTTKMGEYMVEITDYLLKLSAELPSRFDYVRGLRKRFLFERQGHSQRLFASLKPRRNTLSLVPCR